RRPQGRVPPRDVKRQFLVQLPSRASPASPIAPPAATNGGRWEAEGGSVATAVAAAPQRRTHVDLKIDGVDCKLHHGSVVIAAITSCTNTSNPSVMVAAGLVAKKAVERGLRSQPWVKTSLAPGSKVVTDYLNQAGLMPYLEQLRFHLVGYGCTTCIGNSGPLPDPVSAAVAEVFQGDEGWNTLPVPAGDLFAWEPDSTYIRRAPYFDGMPATPPAIADIRAARVLCLLSDSITTDHISPAGSIRKTSPAGKYLIDRGVEPKDFNSYGSRRGNHEVMVRGT